MKRLKTTIPCPLCGKPAEVFHLGTKKPVTYVCSTHKDFDDIGVRYSFRDVATDVEYRGSLACKLDMDRRAQRMK